jgi:hypothetical protein
MADKQLNIADYMQRRYAQLQSSFSNGIYTYKGKKYTQEEFKENFSTDWVEEVTSINNLATAKNPDRTKID